MARRVAITWAFNVVALLVATWLLSGLSYGSDWWALFAAAFVFTLANVFLRRGQRGAGAGVRAARQARCARGRVAVSLSAAGSEP